MNEKNLNGNKSCIVREQMVNVVNAKNVQNVVNFINGGESAFLHFAAPAVKKISTKG